MGRRRIPICDTDGEVQVVSYIIFWVTRPGNNAHLLSPVAVMNGPIHDEDATHTRNLRLKVVDLALTRYHSYE